MCERVRGATTIFIWPSLSSSCWGKTTTALYFPSASLCLHLFGLNRRLLHIGVGQHERMDSTLEAEIDRLSRPPGNAKASEQALPQPGGASSTTILQPQNGRLAEGSGEVPDAPPQQRLSRNSSAGSSSGGKLRSPRGPGLAAGSVHEGFVFSHRPSSTAARGLELLLAAVRRGRHAPSRNRHLENVALPAQYLGVVCHLAYRPPRKNKCPVVKTSWFEMHRRG